MLFVVFQRLRAVHYRKQSQSQELQKEQTVCLLETFRLLSVSKSCISILWLFLLLHHRVHGCRGFGVFQLWGRLNLEQERTTQQKSACSKLWFQTLWSNETCLSKLSKVSSVFRMLSCILKLPWFQHSLCSTMSCSDCYWSLRYVLMSCSLLAFFRYIAFKLNLTEMWVNIQTCLQSKLRNWIKCHWKVECTDLQLRANKDSIASIRTENYTEHRLWELLKNIFLNIYI